MLGHLASYFPLLLVGFDLVQNTLSFSLSLILALLLLIDPCIPSLLLLGLFSNF